MRATFCVLFFLAGSLTAAGEIPVGQTIYVNNAKGNEAFDGLAPEPAADGKSGPLASIMQAVKRCGIGARIQIANTGVDYRESVSIEGYRRGHANSPLIIEGNGATVTGLVEAVTGRWILLKDDIYYFENKLPDGKFGPMPNSNWLGHLKHQGWFTEPQAPEIFFLNGKPGPNVLKLDDIPAGGFSYDTQSTPRRLHFRLPAGAKIADCKLELPLNTGFYVSDDYVTVRNIASKYSQDDGFSGFWGQGVVFENINGSYNCDQGISFHGTSTTTIDGGLFERNGGCGIADVMACITVYRGVTVRNNMIAGALLAGHAHTMLGCRIYGNDRMQVETQRETSINLSDCLIAGEGPDKGTGVSMTNGRMNHCTVVNCQTGVQISRGAQISNCVFSQIGGNLIAVNKDALSGFGLSRTILDLGKVTFGDQKLDKDSWAQAAPQLKFASSIIVDTPKLQAPCYLLPADSPHSRSGEYGTVPGCHVREYKDWVPTGGAKEVVPHP